MKFSQALQIVLFLSFALFCQPVLAASSSGGNSWDWMYQKSEIKKQSRWTLSEWMATREKMRWQDMWLSLNSPSPYEFFLKGGTNQFGVGVYAELVGLEVERETLNVPTYHGRFHLRIFGFNVQNTNLTLHAGVRQRMSPGIVQTGELGASMTLYLMRHFGVFGQYRQYMNNGIRTEGGAFIDFGPLRVFGNAVRDEGTQGWIFGGQLFF